MIYKIYRLLFGKKVSLRDKWINEIQGKLGSCGVGIVFRYKSSFVHPEKILIGDNVWIGENCWFQGVGGIQVGDNVVISRNVTIFSGHHNYSGDLLPYSNPDIEKKVIIGNNVWIGMNVNIVPGVTIGEGAIIGLGTTVTTDVPPLAIVGSVSHRIIKFRDKEHYLKLKSEKRFRRMIDRK
jgi:acetyltransferase-like isoleucine patch superfamily enzyme